MSFIMIRTQKRIKRRGKVNSSIRELYLRDDVKCHSPICKKCSSGRNGDSQIKEMLLDKEASHYAIPDYEVLQNYLEIFELPDIKGLIILQTIAAKILQSVGRISYRRLLNISRDIRRGCAIFLNEICESTSVECLPSYTEEEWMTKSIMKVAEYYDKHLDGVMPIVVITNDTQIFSNFQYSPNVKILAFKNYLETMWGDLADALDLYESISAASSLTNIKDSSKLYENYLPQEILETGVKAGRYIKGILRVNKHISSQEAYVSPSNIFSVDFGDVLIFGLKDRNRAIHGDEVVVELLPENEWKSKSASLVAGSDDVKGNFDESQQNSQMPTGKVIGVTERKWRSYVATLPMENEDPEGTQRQSREKILVVPYDYRIPKIRIATKQAEGLRNERIIVRIDRWDKDSQYPTGHFVKKLGEVGLLETEIQSLLVEHGVSTSDFPPNLLPELPQCSSDAVWNVDEVEVSNRKDFRQSHLIFSIDPQGCEDVDDALSVRELPDGMLELGVHIADVTHFVKSLSLTDLEARSRATSVYLPDRRYDMLPHVLSSNLCSLLGNVDRYAVTVLWQLNSNCEVQDVWFGRSVIRSCYKLSYETVHDIQHGHTANEMRDQIAEFRDLEEEKLNERYEELKSAVMKLRYISNVLRSKRLASGGLELNSINMKFEIDKTLPSIITGFKKTEELEIHKTVAECMIFANQWVAMKISESFPQRSVLRRHPPPREPDLVELMKLAASKGFSFSIHSNKELARSLEEAVDPQNPSVNQIFRILATRSMNEATYFCTGCFPPEEFYHYGLGISRYTHFTSPIRRYADVLVHRLLLASVGESSEDALLKMSELESLCHHMNEKHRAAQDVEKCVEELFQVQYFSSLISQNKLELCLTDGVIYSIKSNGVLVFLPQYGMRGAICLYDKDKKVAVVQGELQWLDGRVDVKESEITVTASSYVQKYSVFDHITVNVKVQSSRAHQPKIFLELFSNNPHDPCSDTENTDSLEKPQDVIDNEDMPQEFNIVEKPGYVKRNVEENVAQKSIYSLLRSFREMTLIAAD